MSGYDFSKLNLLIVDDNKYMRNLVTTILHALNIKHIEEAGDGAAAFETLSAFPADIAICDFMMEPLDGIQFTHLLRNAKDSPNPFLPVIMMTGHTELHRIREARNAGVTEFLAKPISTKGLYARIVEIVENPRPFIRMKTYFGPDRRRHDDPNYLGPERRKDFQATAAGDEALSADQILALTRR